MSSACLTQCFGSSTTRVAIGGEDWTKTAAMCTTQEKRPRLPDDNPGNKRSRINAWACKTCSLVNIGGSSCIGCGRTHEYSSSPCSAAEGAHGAGNSSKHEETWQCEHCTFLNDNPALQCEACRNPRSQMPGALTEQDIIELSDSPPTLLGHNIFVLDCGCRQSRLWNKAQGAADAQKILEPRYVEVMTPLRFREHALVESNDFHFRQALSAGKQGGHAWLRRVAQEQSSLATSLPVAWSPSIFLTVDAVNVSALRYNEPLCGCIALILGPDDTPYATGAFVFDIFLPPEYTNKPPRVHFLTTGGGCLEGFTQPVQLWQGVSFSAGHMERAWVESRQLHPSADDTYFNEPGYERKRDTSSGRSASAAYNAKVARATLQHAVLGALRKPAPAFADIIREHFRMKKKAVIDACHKWLGNSDATTKAIQSELDKLR